MSHPVIQSDQISVGETLQHTKTRLASKTSNPALEAQVLLAHVLERPRAWLLAHPEAGLSPEKCRQFEAALQKLERGTPLPYVLGEWEFYGLTFCLTPEVLIPRPETEMLVERALDRMLAHPGHRRAADVGTGSGCIAVSLALHIRDLWVHASDISPDALQVARKNAQRHRVAPRITFHQADLLSSLDARFSQFDLITANLPYIPTETLRGLAVYGREPTLALDGGPDGLAYIRRLLPQAAAHMAPGGAVFLEIEETLGEIAKALARENFPEAAIQILPDLAGRDRLLVIEAARPDLQRRDTKNTP